MIFGAPPAGSPFAGPTATASSQAAGLPFAGVPSEMAEGVQRILATEPMHPDPAVRFDPVALARRRLSLRSMFAPHWPAVVLALGLLVAETLTGLAGPVLTQMAIDHGVVDRDRTVLVVVVVAYLLTVVGNIVLGRARQLVAGRLGEDVMYKVRVDEFSHLQRMSLDFFTTEKTGVLLSRMTSDVEALSLLVQEGFVNLLAQGLTVVLVTVILFAYDVTLALLVLAVVLPPLLVATFWFRSASERGYDRVRDRIAAVLADLSENLAGIRVITAVNRRRANVVHHRAVVGEFRDANVYTARIGATYGPATETVGVLAQAAVLLVGGWMVLDGELQLGVLAAFVLYVTTFFAPIQQLVQLYNTYQQGQAGARKLDQLLCAEPSVAQVADAVDLPPIEGEIRLERVSFSYDEGVEVLSDIDLTIAPGETVALVGSTGAGKSTLARLIARFADPDRGRVLIDGHDVRHVTLRSLHSQLGVVPQEPYLFGGTVRTNLTFGRPGTSNQELAEAVGQIGLDELIEALPRGLDTPVHERGSSLSAGERQLLALGRAFLARPRVLVLDEATSNLDLASEQHIERAVDALLEGRTAVLIAHRLTTARKADRIGVVDEGRLVELGSHDELVALGGVYAGMWARWQQHAEA
jgi:ATP-binding cassette, subfamily B, bacterial